jgi:hypothetical protein
LLINMKIKQIDMYPPSDIIAMAIHRSIVPTLEEI